MTRIMRIGKKSEDLNLRDQRLVLLRNQENSVSPELLWLDAFRDICVIRVCPVLDSVSSARLKLSARSALSAVSASSKRVSDRMNRIVRMEELGSAPDSGVASGDSPEDFPYSGPIFTGSWVPDRIPFFLLS
jgi:hypothetical protein